MNTTVILCIYGVLAIVSLILLIICAVDEKKEKGESFTLGDIGIIFLATALLMPIPVMVGHCFLWFTKKLFPTLYEPLTAMSSEEKEKVFNVCMTIWIIIFLFLIIPRFV